VLPMHLLRKHRSQVRAFRRLDSTPATAADSTFSVCAVKCTQQEAEWNCYPSRGEVLKSCFIQAGQGYACTYECVKGYQAFPQTNEFSSRKEICVGEYTEHTIAAANICKEALRLSVTNVGTKNKTLNICFSCRCCRESAGLRQAEGQGQDQR
jgi:hypothetical protein